MNISQHGEGRTSGIVVRKNIKPKAVIKAQNVWNKVLWALKKEKPNYFDGCATPIEVIEQFFVWMHPNDMKTYRRICRSVNQAVTSSAFARLNLIKHYDTERLRYLAYATTILWSSWLTEHQDVFVKEYLRYLYVVDENTKFAKSFTKRLPPALQYLINLQELTIASNTYSWKYDRAYIRGGIPPELANLNWLIKLSLCGIAVDGPIPSFIGNMQQLQELSLTFNRFTGSIPSFLGCLLNLRVLDLSYNKFEGVVPDEIWCLPNLEKLSLMKTGLLGPIPPAIRKLRCITDLDLSFNALSGNIPEELWTLVSLRLLTLSGNRLTGSLSPNIRNLQALQVLHLNYNSFTGKLPIAELAPLERNLRIASLDNNGFYGEFTKMEKRAFPNVTFKMDRKNIPREDRSPSPYDWNKSMVTGGS
ncbi:UNVERIFIED_CONTAM: hypothetical protein HDU68_002723 [Siphonaria sp. JEL0065]|nr:hypothetical protein HDU68_002723 [Siphonaria sp. JEL0065]